MLAPFRNRGDAGKQLARHLARYAQRPDVVVLALPRGGVPVAYEVARALGAPLDIFLVRKLGVPGYEELAMGAVATGGARVLNQQVVDDLHISDAAIEAAASREQHEMRRREQFYRGARKPLDVRGQTVILVDDGLATGATMRAAVNALRRQQPARIVVAVPVAARETCDELRTVADEVVCARMPEPFYAVGLWYTDFSQTTDQEVRDLLMQGQHTEEGQRQGMHDTTDAQRLQQAVREIAHPLTGAAEDYDPLLDLIGDARFVLLGDGSHGTHEFYYERAQITRRLITEKGFTAVAVEADWPDAYRANRYVRGSDDDSSASAALADFRRFPAWMWRNTDVVTFIEWLRAHNQGLPPDSTKTGLYGLDLYSLRASMEAVLRYIETVDPEGAARARERYACFDHVDEDAQVYGLLASAGLTKSCQEEAVSQLAELHRQAAEAARRTHDDADEEVFSAEQNARIVKNAEAYYRTMFLEDELTWNLRDRHMVETLEALDGYLKRQTGRAKVVVWEHNSHLGDARATELSRRGELNVGQLVREKYGHEAVLVGATTYHGTVTAATNWDGPAERKRVRPGLPGSYEELFHNTQIPRFLLTWRDHASAAEHLRTPLLERAIGVIYRPETERASHYFYAALPDQFDAVLHFDQTHALEPLERTAEWEAGEVPETYPFAV